MGLTHPLLALSRHQALRPETLDLNVQLRQGEPPRQRATGEAVGKGTGLGHRAGARPAGLSAGRSVDQRVRALRAA